MEKVFILFGSPGSGKSTSCDILKRISQDEIQIIQKESTRPSREGETDKLEITSVKSISDRCDFRYSQYGYEYGFSSQDIWENMKEGKSVAIIVNDIRTIKLLNRKFGSLTHTIYIHSNIDRAKIEKMSKERYPDQGEFFLERDTSKRIEKIKTIHRKYIENTYLFDTAIINIFKENEKPYELEKQLEKIYKKEIDSNVALGSTCRIIIIAAGSFSGKDDLVNAMIHIEPNKVSAYQKGTTRPKKSGDKDELKHYNDKVLPVSYDIVYEKNGYKYGISTKDIWKELSYEKIILLVLSDLESIKQMKKKFNQICSVVYLHANIDKEELEKARTELSEGEFYKREKSISELHTTYVDNMGVFDHVLLNTSESEDLYEQAFNILDHYLE
jgi:guanylate kinase